MLSYDEKSIRALKNVTANEEFFNGHFPQMAAMPGVLQVEAMAQSAGLILGLNQKFDVNNNVAFLAGVDQARFKRVVSPGDQLIIEAHIVANKAGLLKLRLPSKVKTGFCIIGQHCFGGQTALVLISKILGACMSENISSIDRIISERRSKAQELLALGKNPYDNGFVPTATSADLRALMPSRAKNSSM